LASFEAFLLHAMLALVFSFCSLHLCSTTPLCILSLQRSSFSLFLGLCNINPTKRNIPLQRKEMVFRKQYWLFYLLTFFSGARRQIFMAFTAFLLVKKFNFTVQEIATLFLLYNLVNYFLSPFIGKCIVKYGKRKVLSLEYFSLILIFCGYAAVEDKYLAGLLYVADHIFFNFSIAIKTFFQKICNPADIAPSMAVGFTINHIAAVILPTVGGLLWLIDYRIPFLLGACPRISIFIQIKVFWKNKRSHIGDIASIIFMKIT